MSPIRYMLRNRVAANLVLVVLLVGGAAAATTLTVEVFPEIELDRVMITVEYPGATPSEIERGVVWPIEEAVDGLDGVQRIEALANEGQASVLVEALEGQDIDVLTQDVKAAVDRVTTLPDQAERPLVRKLVNRRPVISLVVYGDLDTRALRRRAEAIRARLLRRAQITQVDLLGVPPPEIAIEVDEATLRELGLTLPAIARLVRDASIDLAAGSIERDRREVSVRTVERGYTADAYRRIVVVARGDGSELRLGQIGRVREQLEDTEQYATYDGKPAVLLRVFRVGDQSPSSIADAVRRLIREHRTETAGAFDLAVWDDRSEMLRSRLTLLGKNAAFGLLLVIFVLGLFLRLRLAWWVTLGIPVSMLGAMLVVPHLDVTINMISLFAFILVLGIVVDDAIVVGESTASELDAGVPLPQAAERGVRQVIRPVTFAVLTTVVAFVPLLFVSGVMGKFMRAIPVIVISVLAVSLGESFFILPAHLAHRRRRRRRRREPGRARRIVDAVHDRVGRALRWTIDRPYERALRIAISYRYAVLAGGAVLLTATVALFAAGHVKQSFLPQLSGDVARAQLTMPFGTAGEQTQRRLDRMARAARTVAGELARAHGLKLDDVLRGVLTLRGEQHQDGGPDDAGAPAGGGHLGQVSVLLQPPERRQLDSADFVRRWRRRVGEVTGAEQLDFSARVVSAGPPVGIRLTHGSLEQLEKAAERLKTVLRRQPGVYDVGDSQAEGKPELELRLEPAARTLGIEVADLAEQVRGTLYGSEALRLQIGRDEVKVMVRYPPWERDDLADLRRLRVRSPDGATLPFDAAARVEHSIGYASIRRVDRQRAIIVFARVDETRTTAPEIIDRLREGPLPRLAEAFDGLGYHLEGEQRERQRSLRSLAFGMLAALGMMFALLAVAFRSYLQPLIIMTAIPFGVIGAVLGHLLLGYHVSLMSMFGIVALGGVVVNDSLVLVDFINREREAGRPLEAAVRRAARVRFRPVLLTTLTTFFALAPMLTETSVQARFLIPMAISLACGVLFATLITLVLVPALYIVLADARRLVGRLFGASRGGEREQLPLPGIERQT